MNPPGSDDELPVARALRSLSVFGAGQAGAYREHFGAIAAVFGADVRTRLRTHVEDWARSGTPGVMILTGNAGTGKTAVAQAFCEVAGDVLPDRDGLVKLASSLNSTGAIERFVVKDLSGIPLAGERDDCLRSALADAHAAQVLICANEGILRDALRHGDDTLQGVLGVLEEALRTGAARGQDVLIVNVNRQRPTAEGVWDALIDYLTRETLWAKRRGNFTRLYPSNLVAHSCPR